MASRADADGGWKRPTQKALLERLALGDGGADEGVEPAAYRGGGKDELREGGKDQVASMP